MNGSSIIIDTNVLILNLQGNKVLDAYIYEYEIVVSFVTELEVLGFHAITNEELYMAQFLFDHIQIYQYNSLIRDNTIAIRRQHRLKLPDAIIAATAITLDIPLLTFDKAFTKVDGLQVVVPQV